MRNIFILLFNLTLICTAYTNVRAPHVGDTSASGQVSPAHKQILLHGEEMTIRFPRIVLNAFDTENTITLKITYSLSNAGKQTVHLPLQFVGIHIKGIRITADGKELPHFMLRDHKAESQFIYLLTKHRLSFQSSIYREFLWNVESSLKEQEKYQENKALRDYWAPALSHGLSYDKLAFLSFQEPRKDLFQLVQFNLSLPPGTTELKIEYSQSMFYNERSPGYGGFHMERAIIGLDYLLYPALDWTLSPYFHFALQVDVPLFQDRFLFFPRFRKIRPYCNLELQPSFDRKFKMMSYTGSFTHFPADILSFLIGVK